MVNLLALVDSLANLDGLVGVGIDDERDFVWVCLLLVGIDTDFGIVCIHVDVPVASLLDLSALLDDLLNLFLGSATAVGNAIDYDLRGEQARAIPAFGVCTLTGVVGEARKGVLPPCVVKEGDGVAQEEHIRVCSSGMNTRKSRRT